MPKLPSSLLSALFVFAVADGTPCSRSLRRSAISASRSTSAARVRSSLPRRVSSPRTFSRSASVRSVSSARIPTL